MKLGKKLKFNFSSDKEQEPVNIVHVDGLSPNSKDNSRTAIIPSTHTILAPNKIAVSVSDKKKNLSGQKPRGDNNFIQAFFNLALFVLAAFSAFVFPIYWFQSNLAFSISLAFAAFCGVCTIIVCALLIQGKSHLKNTDGSLSLRTQKLLRTMFLTTCTFLIIAAGVPQISLLMLPVSILPIVKMHNQNQLSDAEFRKELKETYDRSIVLSAYNPCVIYMVSKSVERNLHDAQLALDYLERPSLFSKTNPMNNDEFKVALLYAIPERRSRAEAVLNRMEQQRNNWEIQLSLIYIFRDIKLYDRALSAATNMIRLRPDYYSAYQMRSQIYKEMGEMDKAAQDEKTFKQLSK